MGHHQTEPPAKRICDQLYVIRDFHSRYVVGWMIAERESAGPALAHERHPKRFVQGSLPLAAAAD